MKPSDLDLDRWKFTASGGVVREGGECTIRVKPVIQDGAEYGDGFFWTKAVSTLRWYCLTDMPLEKGESGLFEGWRGEHYIRMHPECDFSGLFWRTTAFGKNNIHFVIMKTDSIEKHLRDFL